MTRTFRIRELNGYAVIYEVTERAERIAARVYGATAKADAEAAVYAWKQSPAQQEG
jgi:hypothetical protein